MAGRVVAGDAFPSAAILVPFLPRHEVVLGVVDALLEGQQGIPLARYAARGDFMSRPRVGDGEDAAPGSCYRHEEQDELGGRVIHGVGGNDLITQIGVAFKEWVSVATSWSSTIDGVVHLRRHGQERT